MAEAVAEIDYLWRGFERRWSNLVKRSRKYGVALPDKQELWSRLLSHYYKGFRCEYCGAQMLVKSPKGKVHPFVWSIEHKIPLSEGGDNNMDNIAFVCHRCNLVKGTLPGYAWEVAVRAMQERLGGELYERAMRMAYRGALANKIERVKKEVSE